MQHSLFTAKFFPPLTRRVRAGPDVATHRFPHFVLQRVTLVPFLPAHRLKPLAPLS